MKFPVEKITITHANGEEETYRAEDFPTTADLVITVDPDTNKEVRYLLLMISLVGGR